MSLLSRAAHNARALTRGTAPNGQFGDSSILPNSMMSGLVPGGMVTTDRGALAISTVLNCVRILHDDMKILPFYGYTGARRGVRVQLEEQPIITTTPFGPDLPIEAGMAQIVVSLKMRGNAYLWVVDADAFGFPTQLQILHPDKVLVSVRNGRKMFRIENEWYGSDQVKHIAGLMMPGDVAGIDPLSFQRLTNQVALDMAEYGASFFANGAAPGGVIEVPGPGDRGAARKVKESWDAGHQGIDKAHQVGILFGGAKFNPITIAPENAQLLQSRAFTREEIAGWYGVPLARLNASGPERIPSGPGGVEVIDTDYAKHTLLPIARTIEAVWDSMIPGDERTWSGFDFTGLLRASALERAQIAQVHRVIGVRNQDEIRADEGWAPIPNGQGEDYHAPLNSNTSGTPAGNHHDPSVKQGQDGQDTPGVTGGS